MTMKNGQIFDGKDTMQQSYLNLRSVGQENDALGTYNSGQDYWLGRGIRRNYRKAFECFKLSFLTGYRDAALRIGICYQYGKGVPRDLRKAALWLKYAAKHGDLQACFTLGYLYVSGAKSWPRDYKQGNYFLEQYLHQFPEDDEALFWNAKSYYYSTAFALPLHEQRYARNHDPRSAFEIIKIKLHNRRCFAPDEFAQMTEILQVATQQHIPGAKKLLFSKRWKRFEMNVSTSEALAARYRRSLNWGNGTHRAALEFATRGSRHEFEIAKRYLNSTHPLDLITGAVLIQELGSENGMFPFAEETSTLLISKFPQVKNDDARRAICRAIGWQPTSLSSEFLQQIADSPDAVLRHIAAWGLCGANRSEIACLLKLAGDSDEYVWDWAIYNLINSDGEIYPELQKQLTEFAKNRDPLMRYQAIAALASRHADNAEELLRYELANPVPCHPFVNDFLLEAAEYLQLNDLMPTSDTQ